MTDPHTFTLGDGLRCEQLVVGSLQNNVFLLDDGQGNHLLVDAADEAGRLLEWIGGRPVGQLVTTHRHHDHIGALAEVVEASGARALCGRPDAAAIEQSTGVAQQGLWTGDELWLGEPGTGVRIEVFGLVGHTPGSIALAVRSDNGATHLFTGDSLFPGGVGKTANPSDFTTLLDDVTRELFDRFDDDTLVHPGHGDSTTLGAERPHLDEWRSRGW